MTVTCAIRYELDPFKRGVRDLRSQLSLDHPGLWRRSPGLLHAARGANNIAHALLSFESLAAYEAHRTRLKADPAGAANFRFAEEQRCILVEERTWLRPVTK